MDVPQDRVGPRRGPCARPSRKGEHGGRAMSTVHVADFLQDLSITLITVGVASRTTVPPAETTRRSPALPAGGHAVRAAPTRCRQASRGQSAGTRAVACTGCPTGCCTGGWTGAARVAPRVAAPISTDGASAQVRPGGQAPARRRHIFPRDSRGKRTISLRPAQPRPAKIPVLVVRITTSAPALARSRCRIGAGAERDVRLTAGSPHDLQQHTVQLPADTAAP